MSYVVRLTQIQIVATVRLRNYRASGVVSDYEARPEATILFPIASEYVAELVASVGASGSAVRRFLKSRAGPV